jgi:hypothetical protein
MSQRKTSLTGLIFLPIWVIFIPSPERSGTLRNRDRWVDLKLRGINEVGTTLIEQAKFEQTAFLNTVAYLGLALVTCH